MDDLSFLPLLDNLDHEILMHRDAHFSGSFTLMIDYYQKEGKGAHPDITIKRLKELERLEKRTNMNLSDLVLTDGEKEEVGRSKNMYLSLRELYESKEPLEIPRLIADLILSEDDPPSKEIANLKANGSPVITPLIDLLASFDFYNPIFPGYGHAPALAAKTLGQMNDERAVIPLFEALGNGDFHMEETVLEALSHLEEKSRDFLLKALMRLPITKDNERAAVALLGFKEDPSLSKAFLNMLVDEKSHAFPTFSTYLILGCGGLGGEDRKRFIELSKQPYFSSDLHQEMDLIIKKWN